MPTPLQIKKLQEITNPLIRKKYLKYLQLPHKLQQAVFSMETAAQIRKVSEKNNLNEEQLWNFSYTVGMILLGEINITEFVKTLQEKCKLEEEPARQVARDINQVVFLPLKEELKKIHNISQWPRENKSPVAPPVVEPKLDGNIVDLKGGE